MLPLWSTPLGVHHFAQAHEVNPLLVRVFRTMRATDERADPGAAFYASRDDLLQRIRLPEWDWRKRALLPAPTNNCFSVCNP